MITKQYITGMRDSADRLRERAEHARQRATQSLNHAIVADTLLSAAEELEEMARQDEKRVTLPDAGERYRHWCDVFIALIVSQGPHYTDVNKMIVDCSIYANKALEEIEHKYDEFKKEG